MKGFYYIGCFLLLWMLNPSEAAQNSKCEATKINQTSLVDNVLIPYADIKAPCIFPFIFGGNRYTGCAKSNISDQDPKKYWCPTKLDDKGEYRNTSIYWGYCNEYCPQHSAGTPLVFCQAMTEEQIEANETNIDILQCKFPFREEKYGYTFNGCARLSDNQLYCPLTVDENGTVPAGSTDWGYCLPGCPVDTKNEVACLENHQYGCGCFSTSGPRNNTFCVFPFHYEGETYDGCTTRGMNNTDTGEAWCATNVTDGNNYIDGEWGVCHQNCPLASVEINPGCVADDGDLCIFPFKWKGYTYSECTLQDDDVPWCATRVNASRNAIMPDWSHCDQNCLLKRSSVTGFGIKSSSIYQNNEKVFGSHLAIDGDTNTYFKSGIENDPTITLKLPEETIVINFTIITTQTLEQAEVKVGKEEADKLCRRLSIFGLNQIVHVVKCNEPIYGRYITIKNMEDGKKSIEINEIKINAPIQNTTRKVKQDKTKITSLDQLGENIPVICLIIISILLVIVIIVIAFRKAGDMKKIEQYVELMLKGDKSLIDPNTPINEQINLLEYDKKYEVNYENINFGDQIGDGQFGKVFNGTTKDIFGEEETKVAIKQIKNTSDKQNLESIILELKIMSNMGNHINIVNFMGATTSNVVAKKINLLLEYCVNGDLKNFLNNNYEEFMTNSRTENKDDSICTPKTLFKWCHEIAKGMEYLADKRIMHGDLAARNILLDEDYVAKISDFGLAKQLYYNQATYKKLKRRMIPWAWMGLEYLRSGEFTLKSDVWSYGILMWEIYSLGEKPYGLDPFLDVKKKLESGWRLPAPDRMSELDGGRQMYSSIMEKCWKSQQSQRPSFKLLVEELQNMMDREEMDKYQEKVDKFDWQMKKILLRCNTCPI